jgi:hypothetical protein
MGAPSPAQGDDGGLLSDLADIAKDTASDIGGQSRGGATGIVGGRDDEDEDEDER